MMQMNEGISKLHCSADVLVSTFAVELKDCEDCFQRAADEAAVFCEYCLLID